MFWDNIAWVYDIFADGINRKANRKLCKVVARMISPTDDVLECACGTGLLSGVIAKRCKSLTATDFSAKMLARTRKKYGHYPHVRFEQADILHLPVHAVLLPELLQASHFFPAVLKKLPID
mgnify:CR=1 FL=1